MKLDAIEKYAYWITSGVIFAVVIAFFGNLLITRNIELERAEKRTHHFAHLLAENTSHTFESIEVLLRETSLSLAISRANWQAWSDQSGWEFISRRHSLAITQVKSLSLFDAQGQHLFSSARLHAQPFPLGNQTAFERLKNNQNTTMSFGPFIAPEDNRYTFGLARRIENSDYQFSGMVMAMIDPNYLQDVCWPSRLSEDFEAVLINQRGEIIATCYPSDTSSHSEILGQKYTHALLQGGLRSLGDTVGIFHQAGIIAAMQRVPGYPDLRIITAATEKNLISGWYKHMQELLIFSAIIMMAVVTGGIITRRLIRKTSQLTQDLSQARDHLTVRIVEATREIEAQRDEAHRTSQGKSRFLAAASHDLRQPLHALSLFSSDLERQIQIGNSAELPKLAEQIRASSTILGQLLDSLLDVSRLDVAGVNKQIQPIPIQSIFERINTSFRRAALDKQQALRIRPSPLWVNSDSALLERILGNLVANAITYTPNQGKILLGARIRQGKVVIEVRDNGIGISREHQEAIFTEFYQVENPAREHGKGLGLGLSIVERLTRNLGIHVNVNSSPGRGACFTLLIDPATPTLLTQIPLQPASSPVGEAMPPLLLIGEAELMENAKQLAEQWGFTVNLQASPIPVAPPLAIITSAALADEVIQKYSGTTPIYVLGASHEEAKAWLNKGELHIQRLSIPIKPAHLRALLGQAQKTFSKSRP